MTLKEKLLLAGLLITIFVVTGGIACNYYSGNDINGWWYLITLLGILVFITVGVIICSRYKVKSV